MHGDGRYHNPGTRDVYILDVRQLFIVLSAKVQKHASAWQIYRYNLNIWFEYLISRTVFLLDTKNHDKETDRKCQLILPNHNINLQNTKP